MDSNKRRCEVKAVTRTKQDINKRSEWRRLLCQIPAMFNYRRARCPGGAYSFTVNLMQRSGNDLLVRHIDLLWDAVRVVRQAHPFTIHAWVVLPEHLHCVIDLSIGDVDFAEHAAQCAALIGAMCGLRP